MNLHLSFLDLPPAERDRRLAEIGMTVEQYAASLAEAEASFAAPQDLSLPLPRWADDPIEGVMTPEDYYLERMEAAGRRAEQAAAKVAG